MFCHKQTALCPLWLVLFFCWKIYEKLIQVPKRNSGRKDYLSCRNNLNIRQSIDGAGEQTFMKRSKTAGGIKSFTVQNSTCEKWVLSRLHAHLNAALQEHSGVAKSSNNPSKCLRDLQIRKSERNVTNIVNVLKNVFIDPFILDLEQNHLYNLASDCPYSIDITESLLSVAARGTTLRNTVFEKLNNAPEEKLFFEPIKRIE